MIPIPATCRCVAIGLLAIAALALGGCGDDGDRAVEASSTMAPGGQTSEAPDALTAEPDYAGICPALAAAERADLGAAAATFDHGPLHELASRATEIDRAVAARLLEAKEQVESALREEMTAGSALAADLTALADATREAQRSVDDPVLGDCEEESR